MAARVRQTAAEWAASVPDHVTAKDAVARLDDALGYSDDAVNAVISMLGSGTLPPPRSMMPDLYAARDKVVAARDAVQALADRAPDQVVAPLYVTEGRKLGSALIDQANAVMDRAKSSDSPAKLAVELAKAGARVADKAATGLLRIGERILTPMEVAFGLLIADELLNKGRYRRRLLGGR